MVHAEDLGLSELLFFNLPLFELLKFQVATKALNYYYLLIVVNNSGISFWLESALFKFAHFFLPSLGCNFLLLLLKFLFEVGRELFSLATAESCRYVLILTLLISLRLKSIFLLLLLNILFMLLSKLEFGSWVAHILRQKILSIILSDSFRYLIDFGLERVFTVDLSLFHLPDDLFLFLILLIEPIVLVIGVFITSLWIAFANDF